MTHEIPWEPVLQVIGTVAEINDPSRFGLEVLNALSSAVPFDIGSFNEIDLDSGRAVFVALPTEEDDVDQETRDAFPRLVQQNPILQYQDRTGDGSAHRLSDFLSTEALHRLELYQRVYQPRGVEFQVAIGLATSAHWWLHWRSIVNTAISQIVSFAALDALRPHLVQAHRNVQALAALQGIDGALAGVGKAIVVLDPQGGVVQRPGMGSARASNGISARRLPRIANSSCQLDRTRARGHPR